jgi:hypothetical protein
MRNTWSYGIVTATLASACAWAPQVHSSTDHERGRAGSIVVAQSSAMARFKGTCFDRTELFFGSGKPDGSAVSEPSSSSSSTRRSRRGFPTGSRCSPVSGSSAGPRATSCASGRCC